MWKDQNDSRNLANAPNKHVSYITAYLNLTSDLYYKLGLWCLQLLQKYLKVTNLFIKVMRISRQPSPLTIMIDQKQLENVECLKYLGSILTNDGRCTCEIKSRIAMAKAAFNKKKTLFTS